MIIGALSAYKTQLELKIYLETHGLKLVKQEAQVAGPDDIVVNQAHYQELVNDVQSLSKEVKPLVAKNSVYKKKNQELQALIADLKDKRTKRDEELLQLADKVKEKIGNYFDFE